MVHVEVNPHFPPPLAFRQHFSPLLLNKIIENYTYIIEGIVALLVGCSISAYKEALGPEYELLHVEFDHALFARREYRQYLPPSINSPAGVSSDYRKWLAGFLCHPARRTLRGDIQEASFDLREWVNSTVEAAFQGILNDLRSQGGLFVPRSLWERSKPKWEREALKRNLMPFDLTIFE